MDELIYLVLLKPMSAGHAFIEKQNHNRQPIGAKPTIFVTIEFSCNAKGALALYS
jgi:hypothetical protein